jgi:hypothetical protein
MEKTYLEILAENDQDARAGFDENAKDTLAEQNEYEGTIGPIEHHHDELEDQDAFKKFGGSHQAAAELMKVPDNRDTSKQSVLHEKNVKVHVINVDSRFRADPTELPTAFLYKFNNSLKNIVSIRISSIEMPNTHYTFSKLRGNTSFTLYAPTPVNRNVLVPRIIKIPDGNYDPVDLVNALNAAILAAFPNSSITVSFNINTGLISFSSTTTSFSLDFEKGHNLTFLNRSFDRGLGYSLGFRIPNDIAGLTVTSPYTPNSPQNLCNPSSLLPPAVPGACCCYQGTAIVDTIDVNYLFLTLNSDWKVVINKTPDRTIHYSFCKVIMTVPKGAVLYDNGANTITKEYWFPQPTNITSFPVRVTDPYDQLIDLNGMDFSFTLELKEILNSSLYETMRS